MVVLVIGVAYTDELSGAAAALVACAGLFGGAAHYGSILAGRSKSKAERATALGFYVGFLLGPFSFYWIPQHDLH